jgi:hypothetical protein
VNKREILPPQIIFTPRKEKEKKKKKKKNIAFTLGGWIGLSRFFGKILPEV